MSIEDLILISMLISCSCVADANDDLANQDIFTLASQYVDGARIVGVWTKCDGKQQRIRIMNTTNSNCVIVASSPGKVSSYYLTKPTTQANYI